MMTSIHTKMASPVPNENSAQMAAPTSMMLHPVAAVGGPGERHGERKPKPPPMADTSRMPALVMWNASRMFGISTL